MALRRRTFLGLMGAAAAMPALPSVARLPATMPAAYNRYQYGVAVFHARTRASITAADLVARTGATPAQASAMIAEMRASGVVSPLYSATRGTMRAKSPVGHPNVNWPANSRLPAARKQPVQRRQEKTTMEKYTTFTGVAAPMPLVNIDTDMIIPKQFLKTIKRSGLGVNLFDEMRYDGNGNEIETFVLNKPAYRNAEIIIAGDNFGCGSSREHAPWALKDFGIRAVVSTSFADIFYNNCFKNGILPIVLPQDQVDALMKDAENGANAKMTVDLENQTITSPDGESYSFEVDSFKKHCLMNGLDDIGLTMEHVSAIDSFETQAEQARPWV